MHAARSSLIRVAVACLAVACARPTQREPAAYAARFEREAVAADHPLASQADADMLRRGGNAVDAAVAASFCLSVVRPQSCGIGGGGFMVIHLPAEVRTPAVDTALNYRETSPDGVGPDFYESRGDDASRIGGAAVATPGTVAGLLTALERFGSLDRATTLEPAIRAARYGFVADAAYVSAARETAAKFEAKPEWKTRFPFLWTQLLRGGAVQVGDLIVNEAQARALEQIALHGIEGFYRGELADALTAAVRADGGVLTRTDLANYAVAQVEPLALEFRGRTLLTMPPPSSGGVVLAQCFATLDRAARAADVGQPWTAEFSQLYVESMKHSFADRARWLADPAFVNVPLQALLDPDMLSRRALSLDRVQTHPPEHYGWAPAPQDDHGTSHLSVVDARGGAVACTETINLAFGSFLEVPGFGFLLNDQMDDFTTRRGVANAFGLKQSDDNLPSPGKRPLSSMTPTIALDSRGRVVAVAGASGGPRIISGTVQALLNVLVFDLSAAESVARPRWHHQWSPNRLRHEATANPALLDAMRAKGHELESTTDVGVVQLIRRARSGAGWEAASDPRKGGSPAGR